jgi:hypothetical protein
MKFTMFAVFVLATLSVASGFSTNRFLDPKESLEHVKEDAMHMWAVSDMELREAKQEELDARNGLADGKAIEEVAADAAKSEEARAKKELKGQDLDAALAVAHDEKARKVEDAKQIEDVATKEEKDAEGTKKEGARVRQDATAIETDAMPPKKVADKAEVEADKADAKQMRIVADNEEKEAAGEKLEAREDAEDSKAIGFVAAMTAKGKQSAAAKDEDRDAKQLAGIAIKEEKDAAATLADAMRMRKDAAAFEAAAAKK